MTSLPWMSSQARTQRSHRMQASWSTSMTGLDESVPRPDPHGSSVVSRATPKPSARSSSRLSRVVVSLRSSARGGWSDISSSVSVARLRSSSGVEVVTSIPSSHGRTQAAAKTRPPVSTTHIRQTPTGS